MKGLIVAAGYGTRFLPVTKTIPKEMLPLIDKPSIDFVIEEFIKSGITEILVITSRRKKVLEDYLDREVELETVFLKENKADKMEKIKPAEADIFFVRQREMMGTGHALLTARAFIGNEPFVVAYPDDIHFGDVPLAAQLIKTYEETGCSVLATLHDPPEIGRYGVLKLEGDQVTGIVEKPAPGTEPSREASIGRFLYTPEIFEHLQEGWENHAGGEYFHTYALQKLMDQRKVVYRPVEGTRLDTGAPEGYLKALIRYAAEDPELKKVLKEEVEAL